ncbi:MAG: DNA-3-methyladenine glycosylase [Halanaerobium sp. 4-GBenrich]|uniref:Putative 3-methyladenine DNA glycosylase n=1 Tax=Halanaerobium congolense TaxID=54121 RepID=A0A1G6P9E1_9FIRM|nr:DNA-3-methyladenine glycosylase [Halanaerobium congolense]KXS49721.1 MAG: DNA-3-methyladenine glycosylase [Halanaerobium sp. T82-1]ODS50765.1 MAG: DNA-3-methyladenine glycosylase [Halanaerobium sp. 4-GBenrich]OEG63624.1 MAG: 3-methyladenine DNA glycosylase [Halanaerobium sp. MDAL1]PUU93363.1 MAG: DNA-3-methyladenine glycosylase [Halanaerobium sp.]PTX17192.1 DNA-3-methyladenine glycosylase [Halanaerobium congolense]
MRLKQGFYQKDAVQAAKDLLGKVIVRKYNDKTIKVKIVETEAYCGAEDKASHAHNNKKTKRTAPMFKKGGHSYIYLIYGMYYCLNVVTAAENNPHAVLIRAVEPLKGLNYIKENRQIKSSKIENLTNGPGKLSQALKINKNLDGCNLIESDFLYIIDTETEEFEIENSPRINIDYAEEYKDKKWRFFIKNNKYISRS